MQVGAAYAQKLEQAALRPRRLRRRRPTTAQVAVRMSGRPADEQTTTRTTPTSEERRTRRTTKTAAAADGRKALGSRVGISRPKPKRPNEGPRRIGRIGPGPEAVRLRAARRSTCCCRARRSASRSRRRRSAARPRSWKRPSSISASTSAWSRSRPGRSSPSSRSSWRPACG